MLSKLQSYYKIALAFLLACAISFGAGWYSKKTPAVNEPQKVTKTEEKSIDKAVETDKQVQQNVKVTKIEKKPDGTVTKEVIESDTKTVETSKEKIKEVTKEKVVIQSKRAEYSLSLGASVDLSQGFRELKPKYHIGAGKRIIGDVWLDAEYGFKPDFKSHEIQLSVRWEIP